MSGPKAFRIVTRAEIISICRRDLARLDAAIEVWTSSRRRSGTIGHVDFDKVIVPARRTPPPARCRPVRRTSEAGRGGDFLSAGPTPIDARKRPRSRRPDAKAT